MIDRQEIDPDIFCDQDYVAREFPNVKADQKAPEEILHKQTQLNLRYKGCDDCILSKLLEVSVPGNHALDVDCADHAVIDVRELRADVREKWRERGVRFGSISSPISIRTGEISETLAAYVRQRMGSLVSQQVSDIDFHSALIKCSGCETPFEVRVVQNVTN